MFRIKVQPFNFTPTAVQKNVHLDAIPSDALSHLYVKSICTYDLQRGVTCHPSGRVSLRQV